MDRKLLKMLESAYRKVVWNAETAWPRECCGALLGTRVDQQEVVCEAMPATGPQTATGRDFFQIGAQDMVAFHARATQNGWEILGFYHSHPDGPAAPSRADLPRRIGEDAAQYGATWPEHCLLIASVQDRRLREVRAYRLTADSGGGRSGDYGYEALEIAVIAADSPECDPSART